MPRLILTTRETQVLTAALVLEARTRRLSEGEALFAAANTTLAELRALVTTQLALQRAQSVTQLAASDTANTARKADLTAEIAAIDSALGKL